MRTINTIKSYYKAVTTTKKYVITEDCSANFSCIRYKATNNFKEKYLQHPYSIICCENHGENLDVLRDKLHELTASWSVVCYQYQWSDFLEMYDLTEYQYSKILKMLE